MHIGLSLLPLRPAGVILVVGAGLVALIGGVRLLQMASKGGRHSVLNLFLGLGCLLLAFGFGVCFVFTY